ncbi:MAG: NAD(P)/FAD-dependent oxidoreductase [Gracilibacteraceae bacterium]|jgi:phytoene dehydrogenase-like protein|nr:NAD(P)/FAD-dependent oxidoreductase [Gracilibacteraceae bacterium]
MSKKYDVVIAGAGHGGLTVGCYLAKAGLDVCLTERMDQVGGGVISTEYAAPGFVTDVCSTIHVIAPQSPAIKYDELGLQAKYGLKYLYPEVQMCIHFYDNTTFSIFKSLDATCQEIAKYSAQDAESYRKFYQWAQGGVNMIVQGFFAPPPPYGTFATMMDSSEEGRELLRTMQMSVLDVINEWFTNEKVKIALTRWISEIMVAPQTQGTGIMLFVMLGLAHMEPGSGMPVGGSGKLSEAMEAMIKDHGGTILTNSPVKEFIVSGGECKGVLLESGEEILASKMVVSNLNIKQLFPGMVKGVDEGFVKRVKRLKHADFACFQQSYALNEAPVYKNKDVNLTKAFITEFAPSSLEEYLRYFDNLKYGIPGHNPLIAVQSIHDPSRAPAGKHTMYFYEYAPYNLKDGGAAKWDEICDSYADDLLAFYRKYTTNMTSENIIGHWFESPLDLERRNNAFVHGDFGQLGSFQEQFMGNRPLPRYNYKTPVNKLMMCGASCHPGSGVSCGGRAPARAILDEMGISLDDVVK